jgi:hypothetical protein
LNDSSLIQIAHLNARVLVNRERENVKNQVRYAICASRKFKAALPGAPQTVGTFNHGLAIAASRRSKDIGRREGGFSPAAPVRPSPDCGSLDPGYMKSAPRIGNRCPLLVLDPYLIQCSA